MVRISPSLLSADPLNMQSDIDRVLRAGIDMLHVDVMDGHFVPNITFGLPLVKALARNVNAGIDVHLMISDPERYAPLFAKAGSDIVTVHVEASHHLEKVLSSIRRSGTRCGVTLRPGTSLDTLKGVLDVVDMVLVMSVEPGFGGQSFMPGSVERIAQLGLMMEGMGVSVPIEIDGGITPATVPDVVEAGADIVVAGSSVFSANGRDIENNIRALKEGIRQGLDRRS